MAQQREAALPRLALQRAPRDRALGEPAAAGCRGRAWRSPCSAYVCSAWYVGAAHYYSAGEAWKVVNSVASRLRDHDLRATTAPSSPTRRLCNAWAARTVHQALPHALGYARGAARAGEPGTGERGNGQRHRRARGGRQRAAAATHRGPGLDARGDRRGDGGAFVDCQAERRELQDSEPGRGRDHGRCAQGRADRRRSDRHDGRHRGQLAQDRRHHRRDRRHLVPDQHPRAQRRGGSRARGRGGPGLRGGGRGSAQPRASQRRRGAPDQGAHRRVGHERERRRERRSCTSRAR